MYNATYYCEYSNLWIFKVILKNTHYHFKRNNKIPTLLSTFFLLVNTYNLCQNVEGETIIY
jgi:hypothetical protein